MIGLVEIWSGEGSRVCGYFSWRSNNSSSISRFISSMSSPSSSLVGSLDGRLGLGSVGMIDVVQLATTSASLLGFFCNIELTIAIVFALWSTWPGWGAISLDLPASNKGALVVSF